MFSSSIKIDNCGVYDLNLLKSFLFLKSYNERFITNLDRTIYIHGIENSVDLRHVFDTRWKGYQKYHSYEEIIDLYDFDPNVTLLIAEDEYHNPVGTVRILDRRNGKIELDDFVDVDSFLSDNEKQCIEISRLSVPSNPNSKLIKQLLFKATLLYCLKNKINTVVASCRPAALRAYRYLYLENIGKHGMYNHPKMNNLEHVTIKFNISKTRDILKINNNFLYNFFFNENHPNINMDTSMSFTAKQFALELVSLIIKGNGQKAYRQI